MTSAIEGTKPDPFNWPTPSRADCMMLSSITKVKDIVPTSTKRWSSMRGSSMNFCTTDIEGKKDTAI